MLLLFLLGMYLVRHAESVSCYTCTYTYTGTNRDKACVDSPWNVTQGGKVTMCPDSRFCTTYRQFDYAMNAVRSFARLCSERMGNRCQEDTVFRRQDCYTTCHEEMCNSGDGVPSDYDKQPTLDLGVGVDSGTNADTSDTDDTKHANNGPSVAGTRLSGGSGSGGGGVGGGGGGNNGGNDNNGGSDNNGGQGNNGGGNNNDYHNNNNNNGNNNDNNGNNKGNNNNNANNDGNNNGNNVNYSKNNTDGSSSSDDGVSPSFNSSENANMSDNARTKKPLPLPAWKDEWNFKEGSVRKSGSDTASASPLICAILFVCLQL